MVKLLDVTLRDGGYTNSFQFEQQVAIDIVDSLHQAGIDYIEIGYRNGPEEGPTKLGLSARVNRDYIHAIRTHVPGAKIVVMLHPHNISEQDLLELKEFNINVVRICIRSDNLQNGLSVIRSAKQQGLFVSANFVRVTYLSPLQIREWMLQAEAAGADWVYFADSNGHMVPDQVKEYAEIFKKVLQIPVGFHAHHNLSLGLTNTLAAIESGIDIIDASLRGLGKGAGNLPTEVYVSYLERMNIKHNYDLVSILKTAEYLENNVMHRPMYLTTRDLMFGMANFSNDFINPVMHEAATQDVSWQQLTLNLSKRKPIKPVFEEIKAVVADIKSLDKILAPTLEERSL
ncbi:MULTISPECIES: hypothetical protein [Aneurinibacillus]|uniref:4-hydroxy 2-oxovalerate aldolase n=1 Tax=Aneurinibacillus thermoaerophilus TaxID=143495 RepID=A0A1G8F372_ANETH|nr:MULTISPECIES: hypothetical protein [Aneurinibacillus]AMA73434.1 hypothetical protein ACH33_11590 [Aneurinibacillus sp. XH2]MED0677538.1 hypothetical protein [Aneurinibacillus thermoaerophilus]MED0738639.1 hypothetical protein [Aneurinibacillus thermoaerophilus]MED0758920.1 hypothetical protein [Aneurinibacillus thermoaerophilus]MED0760634.1 hypothetical protein [Aneurinibacillus thermoaerophilus]